MERIKLGKYDIFVKTLGQFCAISKLYKFDHPIIKEKILEIFAEVTKLLSDEQVIFFTETETVFLVNGEHVTVDAGLGKRFVENFHNLRLGSLELKPGLNIDEFTALMQLLTQGNNFSSPDQIKQFLTERGVQHAVPFSAMYKLVKEDEAVVKENKVIKIDEIDPRLIEKFRQDLQNNNVGEELKNEGKLYKFIAHNSGFLFKTTCELLKKNPTAEEFERILWLIGDYLIDEINSAKAEKFNSGILDELKNLLFSLCEQRPDKEQCRRQTQAAFDKINATMQLSGLLLLYTKHKKGIETAANKLTGILATLPRESRLYQKTMEKLQQIGVPMVRFNADEKDAT